MLSVRRADGGWGDAISCLPSCDTAYFLKLHRTLWERQLAERGPSMIFGISVHLGHVSKLDDRTGDLLLPIAPATPTQGERVSTLMDQINRRYGADTIKLGVHRAHPGFFERG